MAHFAYTYSLHTDFPNHKADSDRLSLEVNAAEIAPTLLRIDTFGDSSTSTADAHVDVIFDSQLTAVEEGVLDDVVAAHSGDPLPCCDACFHGAGSPEGVVSADIGCIYKNTDGGAGVTLWVKEDGNGTKTGWSPK